MIRLAALAGSTAKWIVPASFSYGPASPNALPPSRSARESMSTRTTSADAAGAEMIAAMSTAAAAHVSLVLVIAIPSASTAGSFLQ